MSSVRNSAKAVIIHNERLLAIKNRDPEGDWYILPGGGQNHGETLHDALRRECREEIDAEVTIGPLLLIREYIGKNHEFAAEDSYLHQVEFMFQCQIDPRYSPVTGHIPDAYQTGVSWLPLSALDRYRLYPSVLRSVLKKGEAISGPVYLGDVN